MSHTKIRVHEHAQVFRRDEEARYESMDCRWEFQEHRVVEEKAVHRQHAGVDSNRRQEYGCSDRPANQTRLVSMRTVEAELLTSRPAASRNRGTLRQT
jgi:hypothetical protein